CRQIFGVHFVDQFGIVGAGDQGDRAMSDETILLDPTAENAPEVRPRIARRASLEGLTFGLLDINKPRGNEFLDRVETLLKERGDAVERFSKPRFSQIAPDGLKQTIQARCQVVIEALAD